jgi:hypothetical protein
LAGARHPRELRFRRSEPSGESLPADSLGSLADTRRPSERGTRRRVETAAKERWQSAWMACGACYRTARPWCQRVASVVRLRSATGAPSHPATQPPGEREHPHGPAQAAGRAGGASGGRQATTRRQTAALCARRQALRPLRTPRSLSLPLGSTGGLCCPNLDVGLKPGGGESWCLSASRGGAPLPPSHYRSS